MPQRYGRELQHAYDRGMIVFSIVPPWAGADVVHAPRRSGDHRPWVVQETEYDTHPIRLKSNQCRARPRYPYLVEVEGKDHGFDDLTEAMRFASKHNTFAVVER